MADTGLQKDGERMGPLPSPEGKCSPNHATDSPVAFISVWSTSLWTVTAAFGTYFCTYAFRKPFAAIAYPDKLLLGIDEKTLLVIAQVLGYMVAKFVGIRVIAEMPPSRRPVAILVLVTAAHAALGLLAIVPKPLHIACMFLNGLPLGMLFGLVLGFLEGRRQTEALAAGLCIVSSWRMG